MPIPYLEPGTPPYFPDPAGAEDGLVAVGGDLSAERLLHAYDLGIFPWFSDEEGIPLWWCPDPRGVIQLEDLHVSRRLGRTIARGGFTLTWNHAFGRVIRECAARRPEGTWIHPSVIAAYEELHALGNAHSLEVWIDTELAGGIYGVQRGGLFAAESKFHRRRDMSKVALVACVRSLFAAGVDVFDVQFYTPYLGTLGATEWPAARYLAEVARTRERAVDLSALEPRL